MLRQDTTMKKTGKFVISLDFELLWGMRDHKSIEDYGENILGVREALPRMLALFREHDIRATFATVGFLFASNKRELLDYSPEVKPGYEDDRLSPYGGYFDRVRESEGEDKYHFASELIDRIKDFPEHEIATHTFSHYYCNCRGQTVEQFAEDMRAAVTIARRSGVELRSVVFPRNMFNSDYVTVCGQSGIKAYRGNETLWFDTAEAESEASRLKRVAVRAFRLLDSYVNLSGHHCYPQKALSERRPYNIPSSRFLRPYSPRLRMFEGARKRRILRSMSHAAKRGLLYHLWWHPHNFGTNQDENFAFLEDILKHYGMLNRRYGFTSVTMGGLAEEMEAEEMRAEEMDRTRG